MNERLTQIIKQFWDSDISTCKPLSEYSRIAQHFYNLALEDVRKGVETIKETLGEQRDVLLEELLDFIDKLTK